MTDEIVVDRVRSETTRVAGRSLNQARSNHLVIDSSSGPSEAITSIEAFLAGISSCGVNVVHREAVGRGLRLTSAELEIVGRRPKADTSSFVGIDLRFRISGVTEAEAKDLVDTYTRR